MNKHERREAADVKRMHEVIEDDEAEHLEDILAADQQREHEQDEQVKDEK